MLELIGICYQKYIFGSIQESSKRKDLVKLHYSDYYLGIVCLISHE